LSLPKFIPKLGVKMGCRGFPNFSAISNTRKFGLVLKCSQNQALELNKVRFFCFGGSFYFKVYRIKHGKSGAKKIRGALTNSIF
jgi:hypothetical protein